MKKENFFEQPISKNIWFDNYKWETDQTPEDTFRRVAKHVAKIEKDAKFWEEEYYKLLVDFSFVPGGRIISNAGTNLKGTSYVNCFVSGFKGQNQDSIESIYEELGRQALILKSEGGYGCNFSVLRPRGAYVQGIGVESPGVVEMMKLWDQSSAVITAGSGGKNKGKNKIRKGAMMGVLNCWHPAIEEFVTIKQQPGVLTHFNLSVYITDDFMRAVKNHLPWQLVFPDTTFPQYDIEWDGDLDVWLAKKYPVKIWKEFNDANKLWNLILKSTYNRAEPGVIFGDRINKLNNLFYTEKIFSTNPCGEQPLQNGGSCVLSSINLAKFVDFKKKDFDYSLLKKVIPTMVRFLDAVNDLTSFPLKEQKKEALQKRRIGLGYMGYASALYLIKIPYGSEKALKLTQKLVSFVTNEIYQASAFLAQEKGSFPLYQSNQYLRSSFVKQALTEKTINIIKKNGLRNSHLTTVAPTGNSSIFANNVSGGIEPVISHHYVRTIILQKIPRGLTLPKNILWETLVCENQDDWQWVKEGDESLLRREYKGKIYKIDRTRGITYEENVVDYAVQKMGKDFLNNASYAKTLFDLSIDDHLKTMGIFARYADSAVSKTVNVPNECSFENFKNVYSKAYDSNYIKGLTTYRIGTMASVVISQTEEHTVNPLPKKIERPKILPCDICRITVRGEQWIVFIGLLNEKPYEVFAGKINGVNLPKNVKNGYIFKQRSKVYSFVFENEILVKNIVKTFESDENECVSRLISTALRYGAPIDFVVEQLSKSKGSVVDFSKSIMRSLKKYILVTKKEKCPLCSSSLIYTEGCIKCTNCSWSKCG